MSHNVKHTKNPGASLSHHGLLKLFIVYALSRANQTWDTFLRWPRNPRHIQQEAAEASTEEEDAGAPEE